MQITFQVSGGFGGLFAAQPLTYQANVDSLPEPERSQLLQLLQAAGVPGKPLPATPRRAGAQHYRLTLDDAGQQTLLDCDDASAPPELRPLLGWLQKQALARRGA